MRPHSAQRAPPEHGLDQAQPGCGMDESVCARGRTKYSVHTARSWHCIGANDRNAVKEKANILCTIREQEKAGATFLQTPSGHVAALGLGKLALLAAWAV